MVGGTLERKADTAVVAYNWLCITFGLCTVTSVTYVCTDLCCAPNHGAFTMRSLFIDCQIKSQVHPACSSVNRLVGNITSGTTVNE